MLNCSACGSKTKNILDFGEVALAGGFLKPEQFKDEKKYRLRLNFCPKCYLVQLADRVPADVMFRDYFYFSSANSTIKNHFAEYAREVQGRFTPKTVLEIGCNDGVLLEPLKAFGINVIGVDPSSTVPRGANIINDYFTIDVAKRIGKVDMVIANNVFAHIDDIKSTIQAIIEVMKDDGVFIMEAHYLTDMIFDIQYDWIYHEHIYYYSLLSLRNLLAPYGLKVFDVKPVDTHGGSMRYYICKDKRRISENVDDLLNEELLYEMDELFTYKLFASKVKQHKQDLQKAMRGITVGYGASGRANALIQYCDLKLDYIVDDAPAKHGFYTPGSHIPITKEFVGKPDVVLFAWTYQNEIQKKCDLEMVAPFPYPAKIKKRKAA
jgi:methylation protein EvaC